MSKKKWDLQVRGGLSLLDFQKCLIQLTRNVVHDVPGDRSVGEPFDAAQRTKFKYCTIRWKINCEEPPCIDTGERNENWPQSVLFSK